MTGEGTFLKRQVIVYDEEPQEDIYDVYGNALEQSIRRYSGMDEASLWDIKEIVNNYVDPSKTVEENKIDRINGNTYISDIVTNDEYGVFVDRQLITYVRYEDGNAVEQEIVKLESEALDAGVLEYKYIVNEYFGADRARGNATRSTITTKTNKEIDGGLFVEEQVITYDEYDVYGNAGYQIIEKKEAEGSTVNIEKKEIWTEYGNSAGDKDHIQGNASKSTISSTGYYEELGSTYELFLDMQVIEYTAGYDTYGNAFEQTITKYNNTGEGVRDLWLDKNSTDYWRLDSKEIINTYGDRGEHFGNVLTSNIVSNEESKFQP